MIYRYLDSVIQMSNKIDHRVNVDQLPGKIYLADDKTIV